MTSILEDATPGERSDVYSLLAAWDQSIATALDRGDESIDPNRLRHFNDSYRFDLDRAAAEYGRANGTMND